MEDQYKVLCDLSNGAAFDDCLKANISQTVHPIHSMFGSGLEFSRSVDRMAIFPVWPNSSRWVGTNMVFSRFMRQYPENVRDTTKVTIND